MIQGYYLSKPLAPDDMKAWLLDGATLQFTPLSGEESGSAPTTPASRARA